MAPALMARVGYDAPPEILAEEPGFFSSRLGVQDAGPEFVDTLGEEYGITGIIFKRQNAGGGNHVARLILVELMAENGLTSSEYRGN